VATSYITQTGPARLVAQIAFSAAGTMSDPAARDDLHARLCVTLAEQIAGRPETKAHAQAQARLDELTAGGRVRKELADTRAAESAPELALLPADDLARRLSALAEKRSRLETLARGHEASLLPAQQQVAITAGHRHRAAVELADVLIRQTVEEARQARQQALARLESAFGNLLDALVAAEVGVGLAGQLQGAALAAEAGIARPGPVPQAPIVAA
jgi:hypothetical protein